MEKGPKTNITKTEYNHIKKNVNPFRVNENNYYISKKLGIFDFNDNTNMKNKHFSDRKLIKINFPENKRRKTVIEKIKKNNINDLIKLKSNINNVNLNTNSISITTINIKDIYKWKEILYNHNQTFSITQLSESKTHNDDDKILNQNETDDSNILNNSDDLDVLKKDVIRTRVSETKSIKEYVNILEILIKFFIKENKAQYKQGLNEIVGAFLLLKYSNIKEDITLSEIYNLLNGFINLFDKKFF